ncbi:sulfotransferase [Streptomonospora sp. PA3]|uniref:sulfotransferase family protein n=1 Tax=Streptomonospora sp. PA3 TaxID=2607326 RepID=UPI0012DE7F1A|nr:sulfotransferase [Streptomonospora sp. PA3]MUL41384.1 sulfotransferase [Streptomonospora sp. PA3]
MSDLRSGIKRRARLLGEALRPPRSIAAKGGAAAPASAGSSAQAPKAPKASKAKKARPPKHTVHYEYGVPIVARHVPSPVFVISPVRSGSTLLRMLLNSHSRIRAPHELHLRTIEVQLAEDFSAKSMGELGLDRLEIEHVLWDRILHLELERSGKDVIVDKTPGNVWAWERLSHAWPHAKFIFLLRHPEGIVSSLANRKNNTATRDQLEANVLKYLEPLEKGRNALEGHTVRYEDLTAHPEETLRKLCVYLDVDWEPGMLDYGEHDHGEFVPNLGDRSANIRSGRIQAAREIENADKLSPELAKYAKLWGYS